MGVNGEPIGCLCERCGRPAEHYICVGLESDEAIVKAYEEDPVFKQGYDFSIQICAKETDNFYGSAEVYGLSEIGVKIKAKGLLVEDVPAAQHFKAALAQVETLQLSQHLTLNGDVKHLKLGLLLNRNAEQILIEKKVPYSYATVYSPGTAKNYHRHRERIFKRKVGLELENRGPPDR